MSGCKQISIQKGGGKVGIINIDIENELHKKMKMEALRQDKSVKQYITDLIKQNIAIRKEQTE